MNITITQQDFENAYQELNISLTLAQQALETYQETKENLDTTISDTILAGAITGKNETERKAQITQIFGGQQELVRELLTSYDRARILVQQNENRVACLRAILRLYEVAKDPEV